MTKKNYVKYRLRIESRYWEERDIKAFRQALGAASRNPDTVAFAGRTNREVAAELLLRLEQAGPARISPEQSAKGLAWLKRVCFTKKGEVRDAKSRPFSWVDCAALRDMLPNFSHWTFDGLEGGGLFLAPIYTLHTTKGERFDYVAPPLGESMRML